MCFDDLGVHKVGIHFVILQSKCLRFLKRPGEMFAN
jgi:hypothetical protein